MLVAVNLKNSLLSDPVDRVRPLDYNERTRQVLPLENNQMQELLNNLEMFTSQKQLKIKERKTNVIKFKFSRTQDFPPELDIPGFNNNIEVIKESKLLGFMISDYLKWNSNTDYISKKAYKKMWVLRRMKVLDLEPTVILDVYLKEIRSLQELIVL